MGDAVTKFLHRLKARRAAREVWIASQYDDDLRDLVAKAAHGDEEAGKLLLATHPDMPTGIDPATLFLLIQIAIKLWLWWQSQNVSTPSMTPIADEPFDQTEED